MNYKVTFLESCEHFMVKSRSSIEAALSALKNHNIQAKFIVCNPTTTEANLVAQSDNNEVDYFRLVRE